MKSIGRIILGVIVLFIGITMFNYANSYAIHRDISEQGDEAIKNDDLTMFINRFEYYKEDALVSDKIVVNDDVSFDLNIYQQANVKGGSINYLTILVSNLTIEDRAKELKLKIDYKADKKDEDDYINLVSIGKENWYLQWIGVLFDEINSISIYHKDLLLYKSDITKPFLKAEDYDLASFINGKRVYNGVINKANSDFNNSVIPDQGLNLGKETLYEIDFNFKAPGLEDLGDLYLEGHFNNFNSNFEQYKLTKNREGIYTNKFNFQSEYEKLIFSLVTEDGKVVTDEDDNILYFTYNFVDEENFDIEDYGIIKSIPQDFNKYSYYKWVSLIVYSVVLIIITSIIYLVKMPKQTKVEPVYNNPNQQKIVETEEKQEQIEEKKE